MADTAPTLNRDAAITRSLLGWGVVAGPFYLIVGLVLALTRPGFDLSAHALSLLTLGEGGWMQRANLVLSGLMVLAAAYGIFRAIRSGRGLAISALVAVYGAGLILSAIFRPDPMAGFPPDAAEATASTGGILHLVFGALGFLALAAAALAYAAWMRADSVPGPRWPAIGLAVLIVAGFVGGAALATTPAGVALLWLAVTAGWLWLALACARIYRWVPHPDTGEVA
ncbi:DUF998 domain-containing protein [Pseudactinotalea sp. Z1739]|uniref:DUF998 domain-containing protein n=1 Tax=Pseudactinotalea sp. Z1739 TaxID=3413028 RepID=UPI003C7ED31B